MRRLIDPEVMRNCEAGYFRASGVASIDVMEVAARALADAALERFPNARRVFIACGPGGNGGDGYACARMLRDAGLDVCVYPAAPAKSADAIANAARVRELIRDAGAQGSRTPVDSGAGCEPRIPNDTPSGIRAPSIAEAQSADLTANDGTRISDSTPAKIQPSVADVQPAVAEADQPQFGAVSPAYSSANGGIRILYDTPTKLQPSGAEVQPAEAKAILSQACEEPSAHPVANDGIRAPLGAPTMIQPPIAEVQPTDANARPAVAKAIQDRVCKGPSARPAASDGIQIPVDSPVIMQPADANARPAVAKAIQSQSCHDPSAYPAASDGIRIPNGAPTKIQPSGAEVQPTDANTRPVAADIARSHAPAGPCLNSDRSALGGPVAPIEIPDLWIDCLYGTGLSRAPSGVAAELISRMNRDRAAGAKVLAADIPSGLNGATGARFEPCVVADLTVAFQFAKPGHLLGDGLDVCGELRVADVGFPEAAFPANLPAQIEPSDLRGMFAPRRRNIHKGSCGHLLIVAGSLGMAGAAALCARAALRSGVGLASIACPASIVPILQGLVPCAMCVPLSEREGAISPEVVEPLRAALRGKSAVVIGPGLSRRTAPEVVATVLESGLPAVIDADALNLIAENPGLKSLLRPHHILTPHPGEAARLLGHPCTDPIADARELAMLGAQGEIAGDDADVPAGARDEASTSLGGNAVDARSGAAGCLAMCAAHAQSGAAGERAAGQSWAQDGTANSQMNGTSSRSCSISITDTREFAAAGSASAQAEVAAKRATGQSCASGETTGHRADGIASCSCSVPSTDAREFAAPGAVSTQAEATAKRATGLSRAQSETVSCQQESTCNRSCSVPSAGAMTLAAPGTASARAEATGERATGLSRAQSETVSCQPKSTSNRSCSVPSAGAKTLAAPDATSGQAEATGKCATGQSHARNDASDERVESLACAQGEPAQALNECAEIPAGARAEAVNQRVKFLACMQEKPVAALNRCIGIPANAQPETPGERAATLADKHAEASHGCANLIASAHAEVKDDCAELIAGGHTEALSDSEDLIADVHTAVPRSYADSIADSRSKALSNCPDLAPDTHTEAPRSGVDLIADAHAGASRNCADIVEGARVKPTCARARIPADVGEAAHFGPTAVLKGASRVIAGSGEVYVSTSGAPGMARGGSGDVYAGILGALLAEKSSRTPAQSAAAACELHGLAGELAQAKYGPRAMNSADLIEFLPEVFRSYVD